MRLIDAIEQIEHNDCEEYCKDNCSECRWGIAIGAIEKQIPKIPYLWGDGHSDGEPVIDMWECPNCGKDYELDYEKHKYCPSCGQAIDLEVDDDTEQM